MRRFLQKQFKGRQKYSLIWDGASIHNCQLIKDYLQENQHRQPLLLYRLPAYAPELNPIELLWSYLKGTKLANLVCKTLKELKQKVTVAMEEIKNDKELIKSFFRCKKVDFMHS